MLAIDLAALARFGVKALLIDIDNTLLPRDTSVFPPEFLRWVRCLPDVGFGVHFVSNNWHEHIHERAAEVGFPVVAKAVKPLPRGFREAARRLGVTTRECAVVGDQIFTDILGGNLVGATTVLVQPLSVSDLPHTLVLRRIERVIMAGREPATRSGP
ncbi:MAG: YqeG family HAD IIIA-type phosphatase [Coriobacteriia bacterium]|nr:YqeG family HAD IIIA-type phosphatase [Coriobacteriia bacterium]